MGVRFGIEGMRARLDAKSNPRDYGMARNFGSGLRNWRTLLGTLRIMFSVFSTFCFTSFGDFIWHLSKTTRSHLFDHTAIIFFAFCQRKNVRLLQTWRTLAQTLKGPGLQITRNPTSRLLKQQWSIKNIWVHPIHNLQRWPWSQVKRKRKMFFKWVLSSTFDWPNLKML